VQFFVNGMEQEDVAGLLVFQNQNSLLSPTLMFKVITNYCLNDLNIS
jgi:hypothetical protein